jgi:serpin B
MTRLFQGTAAFILSLWAVAGCEPAPVAVPPADVKALVAGGNAFAIDLYKQLAGEKGNVVCSPYSVSAALAMTYAGARGDTAAEMAKVLGFTTLGERVHPAQADLARRLKGDSAKGQPEFNVANALWGQRDYGFRPEFLKLTQAHYGAGLREVDYVRDTAGSRKTINAWVGDQTKGKIPELIPDGVLSSGTRLVLTNAIYFKGSWLDEFKPKETTDDKFRVTLTESVPVRMMNQHKSAAFYAGDGVKVVRLPHQGKAKSMLVVVPDEVEGLAAVEGKLSAEQVVKWRAGLHEGDVQLQLPKFKATAKSRLGETLRAMGMPLAFTDGGADFTGMSDREHLFIGAVVHEAVVEVDEQGTVAAAATAVEMKAASAPLIVTVRADRPFLFLIVDDATQAILFVGRVTKP